MKRFTPLALLALLSTSALAADPPLPHTTVFERGQGDYHTYRIPATVLTKDNTLLAFCEARKDGGGDAGNIDLVLKRSTDLGKTWSDLILVWDDSDNTCGNPAPVVDRRTGRIWLPLTWNLGSDHERDIMAGKSEQPRHVYITYSDDDGLTWAKPKNISATTRRDHWRWYATGPGNAIQLQHGEHAGRIVVPCNHSDHSDPDKHPYRSHVIYLDPDAHDWQLGAVHQDKTNESAVAEMHDGTLLQAMRSYHGTNRRALAWSSDAGKTFSPVTLQEELDTPVCQATLIALPGRRVTFASPKGKGRSNMTVWISDDSGVTWPVEKTIYAGDAAYSNLVLLPDNQLGLLYEKDGYKTISFTTFPIPSK